MGAWAPFEAPSDLFPRSSISVQIISYFTCILLLLRHIVVTFLPWINSRSMFFIHQERPVEAPAATMIWHHCSAPALSPVLPFPGGLQTRAAPSPFVKTAHSFFRAINTAAAFPVRRTGWGQPTKPVPHHFKEKVFPAFSLACRQPLERAAAVSRWNKQSKGLFLPFYRWCD